MLTDTPIHGTARGHRAPASLITALSISPHLLASLQLVRPRGVLHARPPFASTRPAHKAPSHTLPASWSIPPSYTDANHAVNQYCTTIRVQHATSNQSTTTYQKNCTDTEWLDADDDTECDRTCNSTLVRPPTTLPVPPSVCLSFHLCV